MKKTMLALALGLLSAAAAVAQDLPLSLATEPEPAGPAMPWGKEMALVSGPLGRHLMGSLGLYGRISFPDNGNVTQDGVTWSDLFDVGYGGSLEGDIQAVMGPGWAVGGYLSVGYDSFNGITNTDDLGDTVHPHAMKQLSILAGVKSTGWFDPIFFWEGRIGFGVVHYYPVLADFNIGGIQSNDQEFFRASDRFCFEIGGRVGVGSPSFAVSFGFGLRVMDSPSRGRDVTSFIDPDVLDTFILDLGLIARF
jgi:hypothetical protein